MSAPSPQDINIARKNIPSREKLELLRSCVLLADDSDDIIGIIDQLLIVRQALKGGALNVRGSRHWNDR